MTETTTAETVAAGETPAARSASSRLVGRTLTHAEGRRNFWAIGLEMAVFMTALGLYGQMTFVPLFVSRMTDSPLAVGAVTAAFQLGWLPQIVVAGVVERTRRKWAWVKLFGGLERLPVLGLALCALAAPAVGPPIVLGVYAFAFAQTLFGGLATTPWMDVLARAIPGRIRGRFMGGFTMGGYLLGAVAAALAVPLLDEFPFPYGFAVCFGLAFVLLAGCWGFLFLVIEPPGPPPRPPRALSAQLGDLPGVLRSDPPFRRFVGGLGCAALGAMGSGFLVVYGVGELGAPLEIAGWYTATLMIAQTAANPVLGWLADHYGYTAVGRATAGAGIVLAVVALAAPSPTWLIVAFGALGFVQAGSMLARLVGPVDFAPLDRRPTYIAVVMGAIGLVSAVAPLVGGQVVEYLGYPWLFGLGLILSMAALVVFGPAPRPRR
ncbi:MAG: MFS transporter [Chloroflexi bacterium]|nr:MFS transporter [Chloroflexota bacterium]